VTIQKEAPAPHDAVCGGAPNFFCELDGKAELFRTPSGEAESESEDRFPRVGLLVKHGHQAEKITTTKRRRFYLDYRKFVDCIFAPTLFSCRTSLLEEVTIETWPP
jgi:hypothetical protein